MLHRFSRAFTSKYIKWWQLLFSIDHLGILSAVGDLSATALDSTISLTWNPPFTLDITGVDPDITYRVDVINSTSSQVIHSQGGINVTQYNYTTSLSPERRVCNVFKFTITPVNIVGNGSESSISKGFFNVGELMDKPITHTN